MRVPKWAVSLALFYYFLASSSSWASWITGAGRRVDAGPWPAPAWAYVLSLSSFLLNLPAYFLTELTGLPPALALPTTSLVFGCTLSIFFALYSRARSRHRGAHSSR